MSTFWKQALEAAAWTFLQVFIVTMGAALVGIEKFDWAGIMPVLVSAILSALGAALSIIKSVVVRNIGAEDSTLIT